MGLLGELGLDGSDSGSEDGFLTADDSGEGSIADVVAGIISLFKYIDDTTTVESA